MNKLFVVLITTASTLSGSDISNIKKDVAMLLGEIDATKQLFPQHIKLFEPLEKRLEPLYELAYQKTRYGSAENSARNAGILAEQLRNFHKGEYQTGCTLFAIMSNNIKEKYQELLFTAKQAYDTYQFKTPKSKL